MKLSQLRCWYLDFQFSQKWTAELFDKRTGYCLLLLSGLFSSESFAQSFVKHGPSEVFYTVDLIEGKNDRLFLSATGGIYYSDDLGEQWQRVEASLNTVYIEPHFSINPRNSELYAWDRQNGIYSTVDNGTTWEYEFAILPQGDTEVKALGIDGDTLFVGTTKGLHYFFGPEIARFATSVTALQNKEITALHVEGNTIISGTQLNGVFLSEDHGQTWESRSEGLPAGFNVKGITVAGQTIYVNSDWMGVFYSNDKGLHWVEKNTGFTANQVNKLFVDGDVLYAATNSYYNIYRSDLEDGAWTLIDNGIPDGSLPVTMYASGDNVIVGGWHGVYKSKNGGVSFEPSYNGITDAFVFTNMEVSSDGAVWAVASHTGVYKMEPSDDIFTPVIRVVEGVNYGGTSLTGDILPIVTDYKVRMYNVVNRAWEGDELIFINVPFADKFVKTENAIFLSSNTNGIFKYNGTSVWQEFNEGLGSLAVTDFTYVAGQLIVATEDGLFSRTTSDLEWKRIPFSIADLGVQRLFIKGNLILVTASDYNTYMSADKGEHWQIVEDLKVVNATAYTSTGNIIYAAGYSKLLMSSDNGLNWSLRSLPDVFISSLTVANGQLFLGTLERGIWSTSLKFDQQITFQDLPESINDETVYNLIGSATSGLPIAYSVLSGPGIIIGNELSVHGEGEIIVIAVQSGNEIYNPVTIQLTFHSENITGITREAFSEVTVFPNPASTDIYVTSSRPAQSGSIRLINTGGETIFNDVSFTGQTVIPVSYLPKGMYFLLYSDGKKTKEKKIILR